METSRVQISPPDMSNYQQQKKNDMNHTHLEASDLGGMFSKSHIHIS